MSKTKISAKITVSYNLDNGVRGSNDFNTLQELKIWLDKNPDLAKVLGYVKRG